MKNKYFLLLICTLFSLQSYSQLKIIEGGNVGIDYTDPDYKLKVNGTGYFNGTVTATGAITGASYKIGANDINTAGTLNNVAYKNQNNNFTIAQTFQQGINVGTVNGGTATFWGAVAIPQGNLTVTGITTSNSYKIGVNDINTAGILTNVAYENQANTFSSTQNIIVPGTNITSLVLDGNAWFNLGSGTGYGNINWFTKTNGTSFINTHGTVKPSQITADANGIHFNTAPDNGGINAAANLITRLVIGCDGNTVATGKITGTQLISNIATGTAPFIVTSTTPVANLSIGGSAATVTTNANLTGPVTSVGNATTITDKAVTLAKMADMATGSLIYRKTAGAGVPEVNTLATLKTDLALANVDNTSDANKPVSTAQQTALNLKANLAGPTFTGTVVLPSTTSIGTTTAAEIGYLDATSSVQTQLNGKQAALFSGTNIKTINSISLLGSGDISISSGSMQYPAAGIALSTGTGWGASITNNSAHWNSAYNAIYSATLSSIYLPKWNGSYLVNSLISDNGSNVTVSGNLTCSDLNVAAVRASASLRAEYNIESHYGDVSAINGYFVDVIESSDLSLKTNIVNLPSSTDKLFSLRPVTYNFQPSKTIQDNRLHMGFIAQEVKEIFPDLVFENKDGLLGINYTQFVPVLVQTLKEQSEKIKSSKIEL